VLKSRIPIAKLSLSLRLHSRPWGGCAFMDRIGRMQAVIFCAGKGSRMRELTKATPKPMIRVAGKPILERKLEALPQEIDEVILVISYLGNVIREYFGDAHAGRRLIYIEQPDPTGGTADALWQCKSVLRERFLVMNGDDLYETQDLEACMRAREWAILVIERNPLGSGGKVVTDAEGRIQGIEEGAHQGSGLANAGVYMLDERIFAYAPVPKAPGDKELGLPQTILQAAYDIAIAAVPATRWIQITSPEDIERAEHELVS
jgi:UDP-N-acetylglucosamine diphosphorylase / glucose-1-phosphate thymidylyltransferase / UDP-N-acetylgalactosamine diphosphorylase / glucosamine-1-phosphate N-acetyltransferase / galactosamine-1-phosphate N-acetyltransferase